MDNLGFHCWRTCVLDAGRFAMLESGLTRSKTSATLWRNLADAAIGIMAFLLVGYGLAYGGDSGSGDWFGWGSFALSGVDLSI